MGHRCRDGKIEKHNLGLNQAIVLCLEIDQAWEDSGSLWCSLGLARGQAEVRMQAVEEQSRRRQTPGVRERLCRQDLRSVSIYSLGKQAKKLVTYSEDKHMVREGPVGRHQALAASWWPSTQASWLRERDKEQGQREK